jgi:hypothetical protein
MGHRSRFYIWDTEALDDGPYDVMAMERALNGEPAELNEAEKYETARRLYALLSYEDDIARRNKLVAERVGANARTILRWNKDGWPDRDFNPDGSRIDAKPAKAQEFIEERWASYTQPADDGHLLWTGSVTTGGVPRFRYRNRNYLAARIAYQLHTGNDPQGSARPHCGHDLCVQPAHIEDITTSARQKELQQQAVSA